MCVHSCVAQSIMWSDTCSVYKTSGSKSATCETSHCQQIHRVITCILLNTHTRQGSGSWTIQPVTDPKMTPKICLFVGKSYRVWYFGDSEAVSQHLLIWIVLCCQHKTFELLYIRDVLEPKLLMIWVSCDFYFKLLLSILLSDSESWIWWPAKEPHGRTLWAQ